MVTLALARASATQDVSQSTYLATFTIIWGLECLFLSEVCTIVVFELIFGRKNLTTFHCVCMGELRRFVSTEFGEHFL